MSNKVEVSIGGGDFIGPICESQHAEFRKLREEIQDCIENSRPLIISSSDLRRVVTSRLANLGWNTGALVTSKLPLGSPLATLRVNGLKDLHSCDCGVRHRILVNCMFDNRQAIGTNLLKFAVGQESFIGDNQDVISLGICVSEGAKARNDWDASVAIFDEYSGAIMMQYKNVINARIALWEINF